IRIVRAVNAIDELLGTRAQPERWSSPHAPFLAPALFLRCASDSFSLEKPNTSCKIEWPSSLRSEGVRVHPGMPFGFPSETAFGFAGILIFNSTALTKHSISLRSEEHTSELQSRGHLVCRLLLEKKKDNAHIFWSLF